MRRPPAETPYNIKMYGAHLNIIIERRRPFVKQGRPLCDFGSGDCDIFKLLHDVSRYHTVSIKVTVGNNTCGPSLCLVIVNYCRMGVLAVDPVSVGRIDYHRISSGDWNITVACNPG